MQHQNDDELLNKKQVVTITGLSRATIDRLRKTSAFPPPLRISARRVAWSVKSIRNWMDTLDPAL